MNSLVKKDSGRNCLEDMEYSLCVIYCVQVWSNSLKFPVCKRQFVLMFFY